MKEIRLSIIHHVFALVAVLILMGGVLFADSSNSYKFKVIRPSETTFGVYEVGSTSVRLPIWR